PAGATADEGQSLGAAAGRCATGLGCPTAVPGDPGEFGIHAGPGHRGGLAVDLRRRCRAADRMVGGGPARRAAAVLRPQLDADPGVFGRELAHPRRSALLQHPRRQPGSLGHLDVEGHRSAAAVRSDGVHAGPGAVESAVRAPVGPSAGAGGGVALFRRLCGPVSRSRTEGRDGCDRGPGEHEYVLVSARGHRGVDGEPGRCGPVPVGGPCPVRGGCGRRQRPRPQTHRLSLERVRTWSGSEPRAGPDLQRMRPETTSKPSLRIIAETTTTKMTRTKAEPFFSAVRAPKTPPATLPTATTRPSSQTTCPSGTK